MEIWMLEKDPNHLDFVLFLSLVARGIRSALQSASSHKGE